MIDQDGNEVSVEELATRIRRYNRRPSSRLRRLRKRIALWAIKTYNR